MKNVRPEKYEVGTARGQKNLHYSTDLVLTTELWNQQLYEKFNLTCLILIISMVKIF